jgi:hypothetical protein
MAATIEELTLREIAKSGGNSFQVCDQAEQIIGYIVLLTALARTHSSPWMWMIDSAFHEGRHKTYGFGVTPEDAFEAFTQCWFPVAPLRREQGP